MFSPKPLPFSSEAETPAEAGVAPPEESYPYFTVMMRERPITLPNLFTASTFTNRLPPGITRWVSNPVGLRLRTNFRCFLKLPANTRQSAAP